MTEALRRGGPGIKSVKDLIMKQEQAPPGGFPAIRYARRLPSTGPTGATLFAVGAAISAYGFYKIGIANAERRTDRVEVLTCRRTITPFLQAEEDARYQQRRLEWEAFEKETMSDVPGWEVGKCVYKTREWVSAAPKFGSDAYVFH